MITYVASVFAKPGHELEVTRYYQELDPLVREAPGFRDRKLLRARPGTMEAEVRRVTPPAELGSHPHDGPAGVHFIVIEHWDSVAERVAFARGVPGGRSKDVIPHILPDHSHEFYEDVTPK